jgi:hypothetical protein
MRTTLTLDHDVAESAKALTGKLGRPFRQVINEALRKGLREMRKPAKPKPYRTKPGASGLRPGINIDNVQELLSEMEGEDAR